MINDALDYIRRELRDHLGVTDAEVSIESARVLNDAQNTEGAYITLVNVEEETALRNLPHTERVGGISQRREPAVHLNLYLLFAFEFQTYAASLLRLSQTIELFQSKRSFSRENERATNPFPTNLDRLNFEIYNLNLEALNNLWGVMGGAYYPSLLYKMRIMQVRAAETTAGPEITQIHAETIRR
ncbi:MAG: DUF4255 domain-containing protein [Alphaproteobacteria bacterium]